LPHPRTGSVSTTIPHVPSPDLTRPPACKKSPEQFALAMRCHPHCARFHAQVAPTLLCARSYARLFDDDCAPCRREIDCAGWRGPWSDGSCHGSDPTHRSGYTNVGGGSLVQHLEALTQGGDGRSPAIGERTRAPSAREDGWGDRWAHLRPRNSTLMLPAENVDSILKEPVGIM